MRQLEEIIRRQEPLVLGPRDTVEYACKRMRERGVSAVLVADQDGRLLGLFTGRDGLYRVLAEAKNSGSVTLEEVMTRAPNTLPPRTTAIEALRLMRDAGHRHLPVIEDGRIVGILSRGDFRGLEYDGLDQETGLWERIA